MPTHSCSWIQCVARFRAHSTTTRCRACDTATQVLCGTFVVGAGFARESACCSDDTTVLPKPHGLTWIAFAHALHGIAMRAPADCRMATGDTLARGVDNESGAGVPLPGTLPALASAQRDPCQRQCPERPATARHTAAANMNESGCDHRSELCCRHEPAPRQFRTSVTRLCRRADR